MFSGSNQIFSTQTLKTFLGKLLVNVDAYEYVYIFLVRKRRRVGLMMETGREYQVFARELQEIRKTRVKDRTLSHVWCVSKTFSMKDVQCELMELFAFQSSNQMFNSERDIHTNMHVSVYIFSSACLWVYKYLYFQKMFNHRFLKMEHYAVKINL